MCIGASWRPGRVENDGIRVSAGDTRLLPGGSRAALMHATMTTVAGIRTFALIALAGVAVSCGSDSEPGLEATIDEIQAGRQTTPLVVQASPGSEAAVTFLARSVNGEVPRIVSDVTGWGEAPDDSSFDLTIGTMSPVGSTGWYQLETRVAPRSRIEYLLVCVATDYEIDPNNPRRAWSPGGYDVSEFVTPDFVPPPELTEPPVASAGTTVEGIIDSRALGAPRRVLAYLPSGYLDDGAYPVAVFHGGWSVAREGEALRVLDWLIDHREIEPIVGLFLESYLPGDADNHEGPPLRAFLAEEASLWLASRYGGLADAGEWAVLAISYGGQDALDAALAPAQSYGRLGLLIPGRRLTSAKLEAFSREPGRRLQVAILAGLYDQANLATAREARQTLAGAGHTVSYIEVPEGHNPATRRNHLSDVLISLFGISGSR